MELPHWYTESVGLESHGTDKIIDILSEPTNFNANWNYTA
jgi:hypothetical protein